MSSRPLCVLGETYLIEIFYRFTCAKTLVKRVVCGLKKPSDDSCSGDENMHGNGCSNDFEISRSESVKINI